MYLTPSFKENKTPFKERLMEIFLFFHMRNVARVSIEIFVFGNFTNYATLSNLNNFLMHWIIKELIVYFG